MTPEEKLGELFISAYRAFWEARNEPTERSARIARAAAADLYDAFFIPDDVLLVEKAKAGATK
jgi:hypothetical protein